MRSVFCALLLFSVALSPVFAFKVLNVTMVHQRWDTGNTFNGRWACGPTSTVMAISHFPGLLYPHPIETRAPYRHSNPLGYYVSHKYSAPKTGYYFDRMQRDPSRRPAYGAYGYCTDRGAAWAWRIQRYAEHHGLKSKFYSQATFHKIRAAIDRGNPVVLSTRLTGAGHVILAKGYIGDTLICNDPWGDARSRSTYGRKMDGENVIYTQRLVRMKWMVEVGKHIP
eukprot:gnl/Trimastix_PCT/317.p1 GENE.gnl/Trimastix_PCT/317~~gnl/Trimastix_PCT/317.p1  ORF type:complete len:225 (+),score=45.70 gnl/Trimastix_PCT/317:78-752(+)